MNIFDQFLISLYFNLLNQFDDILISFILVAFSRIIYNICLLVYWKDILRDPSSDLSLSQKYAPFQPHWKSWVIFILHECLFIGIGTLHNYIAVLISIFSILAGGQLLRVKTESFHKGLWFMGWFLNPIIIIISFIYLICTLFEKKPLYGQLIGAIIAYGWFLWRYRGFNKLTIISEFAAWKDRGLWKRMPKVGKVFTIVGLIAVPSLLGGLFYFRIVPDFQDFMIPMRDGIRLKTRVYFPGRYDGNPKPVVLTRSPYNLELKGMSSWAIQYILTYDAIFVIQDMRGCYGSEGGPFPMFRSDSSDGYDTVMWIRNQSWCNGKIATMGASALGISQIMTHSDQPPGLQAASIVIGAPEFYGQILMIGGCFRQNLSETWIPGVMSHIDDYEAKIQAAHEQIDLILSHPLKDAFYTNVSLEINQRYENINVRAVHVGGWYDMFSQGTIQSFLDYNRGTSYAQNHQILVMGPWFHGLGAAHPDITYPNMDDLSYYSLGESLIFKEYLLDQPIDWDSQPRVYYYVMGDPEGEGSTVIYNHWRNAMSWPVTNTPEAWYFHSNGTISIKTPVNQGNRSYLYDPRNPVRSIGGTDLTLVKIGGVDQRSVEYDKFGNDRTDILKFTTETLTNPVELVGNLTAELFFSSNCTDTDFTVKLMDIYPDGKELWIADGILKARYRNGFTSADLLTPGQIYTLNVELWPTAYRFVPGHKIRVSITSSHYNKFALNPNTGGPVQNTHVSDLTPGSFNTANNTILCGQDGIYSCIWFPRTN